MIDETSGVVAAVIFLLFFIISNVYGCGRENIEKEAISRGYATYNLQGKFIWKEIKTE